MAFVLDPAFEAGSHQVGDLPLCRVRLQDDARFPWLILVPRIDGAVELEDLSTEDRRRLTEEAVAAGAATRAVGATFGFAPTKLNMAALGNVTRQLHLHVIGRRPEDDAVGTAPVWGAGTPRPYAPEALAAALAAARSALGI